MTVKQNSQYIKLHPSGAGENQTGATISSDLEIWWVAQHRISQTHAATCYLCSCSSTSDLSACLYFPHAVGSFVLGSRAPYLFNCSPVVVVQALPGRRALLRAVVHALLAFIHDLLLIKSTYGVRVPPPRTLRWKISSFLGSQRRGDTGALYPWKRCRASCQKSWGCLLLGKQMGAGWFQQAGWRRLLLLPCWPGREAEGWGEVSTRVFTHKLLCLLERPACKALIAH